MARLAIARRDLRSLSREKTILLALVVQLFVAAFSSFLVVGLTSLYDPGSVSGGEVEVAATGNASDALVAAAADIEGLRARQYPTEAAARRAFRTNDADGILIASFEGPGRHIAVDATVPRGSLRTTLVVTRVRAALEGLERAERRRRASHLARPVLALPPEVAASPYFGFTYAVLLPLLLFLPVFISGSIVVDSLTEEVERGTLELLRAAPVTLVDVVDGKAAAAIVLAPAQAALWLALLALNGIAVASPVALLVLVLALAGAFVGVGVGASVLFPSRQRAQLLYSTAILVGFGAAALLPEHPATTVARLAVGSPGSLTRPLVAAYAVVAVAVLLAVRRAVARVDPERL